MAITLNDTIRTQLAQAFADLFDVGPDTLTIYGGTPPANANTALATGQPVLATVALPAPAFGLAATGTVGKAGTWEDLVIDATGTATFFRLADNGGGIMQGSISASGGGGDMIVSSTAFTANGTFSVTSFSVTMPGV